MECSSCDSGCDGERNDVSFVVIYDIFVVQDDVYLPETFDIILLMPLCRQQNEHGNAQKPSESNFVCSFYISHYS